MVQLLYQESELVQLRQGLLTGHWLCRGSSCISICASTCLLLTAAAADCCARCWWWLCQWAGLLLAEVQLLDGAC